MTTPNDGGPEPQTVEQSAAYRAGFTAGCSGHRRWAPDGTSDFMRWWYAGYYAAVPARTPSPATTIEKT
jgi:hypothetical protein